LAEKLREVKFSPEFY
jgi:hypothetical protein